MPETSFDADTAEHVECHRNGSVRARGPLRNGKPDGYKVTSMGEPGRA